MSTPPEDFDSAVAALYSQLHQSTTPAAINAAAARRTNTVHDMHTYLHRLGLQLNNNDGGSTSSSDDNVTKEAYNYSYIPPLIIHITGTKGKGSTLSYCESLCRNAYKLTTGMFTSPHLVCIRERIRINGVPISKKVFAEAYWTVRRRLEENSNIMLDTADATTNNGNEGSSLPPLPTLPGYFRMLTLMAFYTFSHHTSPKVDVILLEVGMGGRYDATNVFELYPPPIMNNNSNSNCDTTNNNNSRILVRGITLIDYDHTRVLGSTLEQIAWEKGGIFVNDKRGKIGRDDGGYQKFLNDYCSLQQHPQQPQQQQEYELDDELVGAEQQQQNSLVLFVNGKNTPQVSNILRRIANEEKGILQLVHQDSYYLDSIMPELKFHANHQRDNAALALAICQHAISQYRKHYHAPPPALTSKGDDDVTKEQISAALNNTFWPGRCHTLTLPPVVVNKNTKHGSNEVSLKLRCDGAHTPISINACISWFQSIIASYGEESSTTTGDNDDDNHRVRVRQVLIFNCGHERNPIPLLYSLHQSGLVFDSVYFCRADFERPSAMPKQLLDEWWKEELLTTTVVDVDPHNNEEECTTTINYEAMWNKLKELGISFDDDESVGMTKSTSWQHILATIWRVMDLYQSQEAVVEKKSYPPPSSTNVGRNKIVVGLKVVDAIEDIKNQEAQRETINGGEEKKASVEILVTGSLYLVGSALEAVGWEEGESEGKPSIHQ
jgi:folylpolyglutamate synthase